MVPEMSERASVIIVDDHSIFRMGVVQTLSMSKHLTVAGEGSNREEALELMKNLSPDVALLDISMPGNGLETAREIVSRWPATKVVMLTVSEEDDDVLQAADIGTSGYILKGISAVELLRAVEAVARGENFISPSLGLKLINTMRRDARKPAVGHKITAQEMKVLRQLAMGKSNAEIAETLGLAIKTVKFHFTNLFTKTGAKSRVELALKANQILDQDLAN
jgi:two-component system nitrate/nitrite response regulator NarL